MITSKPHSKPVGRLDLNVAWSHSIARLLTMEKVHREKKWRTRSGRGREKRLLARKCSRCHSCYLIWNLQQGKNVNLSRICSLGKASLARPRSASELSKSCGSLWSRKPTVLTLTALSPFCLGPPLCPQMNHWWLLKEPNQGPYHPAFSMVGLASFTQGSTTD